MTYRPVELAKQPMTMPIANAAAANHAVRVIFVAPQVRRSCYNACMGKQHKKTRRDVAEIALSVVEQAIGEKLAGTAKPEQVEESKPDTRNPAAVALSKLGASKGGRARAKSLSPRKRSQIAKKAAKARWKGR